jgi:hypothetical protein
VGVLGFFGAPSGSCNQVQMHHVAANLKNETRLRCALVSGERRTSRLLSLSRREHMGAYVKESEIP